MATSVPPSSHATHSLHDVHTLTEAIRHRAQHRPYQVAFIFRAPNSDDRDLLTFHDLYQLGGRWAGNLHLKGIGRGDLVVNTLLNSPERAVVEAAIHLSGAASINGICQMSDASDLKAILRRSSAKAVVFDPDVMSEAYDALLRDVTKSQEDGRVSSEALPDLKFVLLIRRCREDPSTDFLLGLRKGTATEVYQDHEVTEKDVCTVFTTSGSSGFSKLVVYTHGTYMDIAKTVILPPALLYFTDGPLGWGGGFFGNTILTGVTRVLCDARAGTPVNMASFIYRSIKEEGVSAAALAVHCIPGLAQTVEEMHGGQPILKMLLLGTQPITQEIIKLASKVASVLSVGYSSTEAMLTSSVVNVNANTYKDYFVGKVAPGVEVKIQDKDGQVVEADTRGQVLIRSPRLFRDYLNDPQTTAAAFTEDGFFRTGDLGWFDSEGGLYVEGRTNDAIMRGSYIFYPGWLESKIQSCPAVRDVMVVGVPDAMFVNELCACVVLRSNDWGIDDVKDFVEKVVTADTKDSLSPRPRHYLVFDSFPYTDTGKPSRKEMAKLAGKRIAGCQ